ncbi:MAG TPA: phospholipid carrier-dependent glycosyltransferase [Jatrophihabitans sp.]|uniref:dolichyl-phosphate-mannose--protein mannosyltransferase n=1 Tax=Jatrophihabitans sp. TaxID=1932789 RepID=UPI002E0BC47F|nr:phospholipid carrier-dependent glycosyltransferase [Jatrophihabitans sp.]
MTATLEAPADAVEPEDAPADPPEPSRPVPAALAPWDDPHPIIGWVLTLLVTAGAVVTRFWALGFPPGRNSIPKTGFNFDEVYYATEAQEMLRYGYEDNRGYMFIVHPPVGKWLIALSEKLWDSPGGSNQWLTNSIGWRIAPALAGVLGVVLVMRIARRMMRSNLFGFIAGLLMTFEGMSLVLARTAILDIFLQLFVIAAFGALVVDRDRMRARLARLIADGADLSAGAPSLGPRPWRLLAGVMFGLACGVKWTALSFFLAFAVLSIVWDRAALKSAGVRKPAGSLLRRSMLPALGSLIVAPVATYLFTYLGWFTGENSWNRHWADSHSASTHLNLLGLKVPFDWSWVPGPIRSLGSYHLDAYRFHQGLDSGHAYQSSPWSWFVLGRPVDFYYDGSSTQCGASSCSREVLLIGTPLMWWAFAPMLLWLAWHWITTRDWRAGAVWVAFLAGWLFWFQNLARTMFLFYMAPFVPFLVIGVTLALGVMLGPALGPEPDAARAHRARRRRVWGIAGISTYLALVAVDFAWMWPIFTGGLLTYDQWHAHMWLPSWV